MHDTKSDTEQASKAREDSTDAYLFAVDVVSDVLSGLTRVGVGPNEQCDALGYSLVNLLTHHHTEKQALLLLDTLRATLRDCYRGRKAPSPASTASVPHH